MLGGGGGGGIAGEERGGDGWVVGGVSGRGGGLEMVLRERVDLLSGGGESGEELRWRRRFDGEVVIFS